MAGENGPVGEIQEGDEVRRRAFFRLGIAAVVTAAALAGLWWLDQGGEKKVVKAVPTPIVTALPQESVPPLPPPGEVVPEVPTPPAEAAAPLPAEAPPPPSISNAQRRPSAARGQQAHTAAPSLATPHVAVPPSVAPHLVAPHLPPLSATAEHFLVQLGVFSNPDHARELVERLNKQGIHAHMETRVQLGPFENRAEAERARIEMQKLGLHALLTPAVSTK